MSTQVSDLYKKHNEVSEDIKSIQESIKDLTGELDKAKAENKGLQSEIILLVKQIASLEKIVNTLNLAQKLKDQKDEQDAKADNATPAVKSGSVAPVPSPSPYATPKLAPPSSSPSTGADKGHGDVDTPPSSPKTAGAVDNNKEPYWINDPAKGIMRNPKYVNPRDANQKGKDVTTKPDNLKEDDGAGEQIPPF